MRAFLFGTLFAAIFAAMTVFLENHHNIVMTSTQIAIFPYLLLIILVVLLNPLCRLVRIARAFSAVEVMVIFMMGMVSAGISTFGLTSQIVPIAGSLFNEDWNNKQSEWNYYVVPYLNERYFVSEPGIQAEAVQYRQALKTLLDKKTAYEAARLVAEHARMVAALESESAKISRKEAAKSEKNKAALVLARQLYDDSFQKWQDLRRQQPALPDWQETLRRLPSEIEGEERLTDEDERRLMALEEKAFVKVAAFRRGLPRDESAFPGILPLVGDDLRAYFGRLRRLTGGMSTLRRMKEARQSAGKLPAHALIGPELASHYDDIFSRATKELSVLCNDAELTLLKERLDADERKITARRIELAASLKAISAEKSGAASQRVSELEDQSDDVLVEMKGLNNQYKHFRGKLELYNREMDCVRNIQTLLTGITALQKQLSSGELRGGELFARINALLPGFASIDVSLRRYFIGQIPWSCWIGPLSRWALLIGLTYIVLMSLNVLIFRQWAHNERLTYPLVELPKALIGEAGSSGLPAVFRNGFFWAGAAVSMSILGWNLFCATQLIPGLSPLNLANSFGPYVDKTQFEALRNIRVEVFFTVIGLSFLVPKNISFSLWFFYIIYMIQLQGMVWAGYGQDSTSFPSDWWYLTNFRNAQGQGGLIIFSGFILYKCRKYILCALFPSSVAELEEAERQELRLSSIAFLVCSFGLILLLWRSMGANLYYTILFYVIILVITVGLVRVVAEGGMLSFQAMANPIHYVRNFFGLDRSWTSASLFAPLMVYYSIIFLDIKTFIAPAFANALKLREDYHLKRFSFHVAVAAAIAVAALTAVAAALMMSYDRGADAMNGWFYTGLPRSALFDSIRSIIKDAPSATTGNIAWTIGGGVVMTALLFFRQFYFWMPHPIGLVMFVNPLMDVYWFSIFLGWICNVAITKYGNNESFQRAKGFFIGLIVGELILVMIAFFVTTALNTPVGITLNR